MSNALSLRKRPEVNVVEGDARSQAREPPFTPGRSLHRRDPNVSPGVAVGGHEASSKVRGGPGQMLSHLRTLVRRWWG